MNGMGLQMSLVPAILVTIYAR